jgi:DNA-binding XRE family transcriptional regulator
VLSIIDLYDSKKYSQADLARTYGVTQSAIQQIVSGKKWKHLNKTCNFSRNGFSKLTKDQVLEIRELYASDKYTQSKLGKIFSVSQTTIGLIIRKKTWINI